MKSYACDAWETVLSDYDFEHALQSVQYLHKVYINAG